MGAFPAQGRMICYLCVCACFLLTCIGSIAVPTSRLQTSTAANVVTHCDVIRGDCRSCFVTLPAIMKHVVVCPSCGPTRVFHIVHGLSCAATAFREQQLMISP